MVARLIAIVGALFVALGAAAQSSKPPDPIFVETFPYTSPSQIEGKWLISSLLAPELRAVRVGLALDAIGHTVGRITVQEGDALDGATDAMKQDKRYVCDAEGSRAAQMEAEPNGIAPSERAEIQVKSDRKTGAGEIVKFGGISRPGEAAGYPDDRDGLAVIPPTVHCPPSPEWIPL